MAEMDVIKAEIVEKLQKLGVNELKALLGIENAIIKYKEQQ